MKNCIAIIPARGGSKRIPKKNIKEFHGKAIISYPIEIALNSKLFKRVIVSTDDDEIAEVAREFGAEVPFIRPKELSDDFTGTSSVVCHAIEFLKNSGEEFDYVCTLYATSPLLDEKYLHEGFNKLKNSNAKYAFSCAKMPFPIQRTFKINKDRRCEMFWPENFYKRSQDLEEAYQDAGQFYFENLNLTSNEIIFGKDSIPIVIPRFLVQDIDTVEDWKQAEIMYEVLNNAKRKNILFRADSSNIIGSGHIMRDLVLAKQYKNDKIIFATQELKGNINYKIKEANYKIEILNTNEIEEVEKLINKYNIDMIIIDHYEIDYLYEKVLKNKNPNLTILSFDDTYEKHYCDILLNHNIYAKKSKYKKLVPKNCKIRCGKKYTLLRDEFKNKASIKENKSRINIFLAIGGTDYSNLNISILETLKKFQNITIYLVTMRSNKNLENLKKYCKDKDWIKLKIDSKRIDKYMRKSNFAIISASMITNEVYFMKLPFIAIKTAENQNEMYKYLKKKDFYVMNRFEKKSFIKLIEKVLK